ncbi:MAG: AlwI family type II restriction endonuclease, partial [Fervidobacterium sp.]
DSQKKKQFIVEFLKNFYGEDKLNEKKINNLYDYGDNAMRYFRLTKYFRLEMDNLGFNWRIDLERDRMVEIEQLLELYSGNAIKFDTLEKYFNYISDIREPKLPWEQIDNLKKIAISLRNSLLETISKVEYKKLAKEEKELIAHDNFEGMTNTQIEEYIKNLRKIKTRLCLLIKKEKLIKDMDNIKEIISILETPKSLRKLEPENFEKILTEALKTLNDELLIQPNYPMDDEGDPISHAPGNKPDIECFYKTFQAICEATLNTSNTQWVQEGQPVMRHLRDFETKNGYEKTYCIFVAPKIHEDTYNTFWIAVKYEYKGKPQKIIPLTSSQFALLLRKLITYIEKEKKFTHCQLYNLYEKIINESNNLKSSDEWTKRIKEILEEWMEESA